MAPPTPTAAAPPPPAAGPAAADLEAPLPTSLGDDTAGTGLLAKSVMQGDQGPFTYLRILQLPGGGIPPSPVPPVPPTPGAPRPGGTRAAVLVPWIRGFKIADNQSPRPQDRVFGTFNYFNNLNADVNRRLGGLYNNVGAYRQLYGFEKTFWDGDASFGLRVPVNTITADSPVRHLTPTRTTWGNLSVFTKFILWKDPTASNLISGGLAVTVPNGPTNFAGAPYAAGFRDVGIQPFVGYFFTRDRWYFQGFESIDIPTDSRDVTMLYNDAAVGYVLYRAADPKAFLRGVAPTFETHVNVPLNHQGVIRKGDPAATTTVVDLTFGLNFFLGDRGTLSVGWVEPVTGPRPFNYEVAAMFNYYFGRTRAQRRGTPGLIGN